MNKREMTEDCLKKWMARHALELAGKRIFTVYNCFDPPIDNSNDWYTVRSEQEAQRAVKFLNQVANKPKNQVWVYA